MAIFIICRDAGVSTWSFLNRLSGDNAEANGATGPGREKVYAKLRQQAELMAARWQRYFRADTEIVVVDTGLGGSERIPPRLLAVARDTEAA
jgi:hypothetical protein